MWIYDTDLYFCWPAKYWCFIGCEGTVRLQRGSSRLNYIVFEKCLCHFRRQKKTKKQRKVYQNFMMETHSKFHFIRQKKKETKSVCLCLDMYINEVTQKPSLKETNTRLSLLPNHETSWSVHISQDLFCTQYFTLKAVWRHVFRLHFSVHQIHTRW